MQEWRMLRVKPRNEEQNINEKKEVCCLCVNGEVMDVDQMVKKIKTQKTSVGICLHSLLPVTAHD